MPFQVVRDNIVNMPVDAIVNAANSALMEGGGVCGAIFRAAGSLEMAAACSYVGHCNTGEAVATPGFALPARHVIHTVGPVWRDGNHGEPELLASCYRSSLELALELGDTSVAFPLISAGVYGFPKFEALDIATREIRIFLASHEDMTVFLVLYDFDSTLVAQGLFNDIQYYIDDVYVGGAEDERRRIRELDEMVQSDYGTWQDLKAAGVLPDGWSPDEVMPERVVSPSSAYPEEDWAAPAEADLTHGAQGFMPLPALTRADMQAHEAKRVPHNWDEDFYDDDSYDEDYEVFEPVPQARRTFGSRISEMFKSMGAGNAKVATQSTQEDLNDLIVNLDDSFSQTLLKLIDERGVSDVSVYKRANISRQHFSKIRSSVGYKPKKQTVLALAVALELSLPECKTLLERAGYALSHADKRDVIVEYFIRRGNYDVFDINCALYDFDQPLLG